MKPLLSKIQDSDSLQTLGRASLQIIHDLKNQLNGLKLYATFLHRRLEKGDRPADEQETVNKLIAGLDRAASDLSTLVEYCRPVEVRKQPGVDLQKIMRGVVSSLNNRKGATGALVGSMVIDVEPEPLTGAFDPVAVAEAFKSITLGAMKLHQNKKDVGALTVRLRRVVLDRKTTAVVEWQPLNSLDHDPFRSFAGSDEIRMSLAAKIVEAHGGSAEHGNGSLSVSLPLM
jgi:signal transduction histidine kinase